MYETQELYQMLEYIDRGLFTPTPKLMEQFGSITTFKIKEGKKLPDSVSLLSSVSTVVLNETYDGDPRLIVQAGRFPKAKKLVCNHAYHVSIDNSAFMEGLDALPELEELELISNRWGSLKGFPTLPHLKKLDICGNFFNEFTPLSGNAVQELNAENNPVSGLNYDGMEALEKLNLHSTSYRDENTAQLSRAKGLRELNITNTYISSLDFLRGMTEMDTLSIGYNVRDLSPIESLKKIRDLTVIMDLHQSIDGMEVLSKLPCLRKLRITGVPESLTELENTTVEELVLEGNFSKAQLQPLQSMPKLQSLTLVTKGRQPDLSELENTNIEELVLRGNFSKDQLSPLRNIQTLKSCRLNG